MSFDVRIVPSEARYLQSFCATLDTVARERRYLIIVEGPSLERLQKFVTDNLQRGGVQFFALDGRNQVVGWCDVNRHQVEGYRHAGALGIGLLPAYRGRGVGARLALAAIAAARLNGIERIELEVWASNVDAIALYRQLGFVEEGVRRRARLLDGQYDDMVEMALLGAPAAYPDIA
jgi:ribosomal protein S18 acetylase RimI-like enzyme